VTATARQRAAGIALAAPVTGVELAVSLAGLKWHGQAESRPGPFGIILVSAGGAALAARRRHPDAVLFAVLAATLGAEALGVRFAWLGLIIAFFSAVLGGRRWAAIVSLVIGYGVSVRHASAQSALLAARLVTLLAVAEVSRAWSARAAAGRRGREEAAARRASEERLAIARDLHDVVARGDRGADPRQPADGQDARGARDGQAGARDRAQLVVIAYETALVRPGWATIESADRSAHRVSRSSQLSPATMGRWRSSGTPW
jgi:hypothetical protein